LPYRSIFFDAAGTLFHSRRPIGASYVAVAREYGLDADPLLVDRAFRKAFGSAPPLAFGEGHSPPELRQLERRWWRERVAETFSEIGRFPDFDAYFTALFDFFANPSNWRVEPGSIELLRGLKAKGKRLGVISNFDARLYRILQELGLLELFDTVTISSEAGFAKPRPEIFRTALVAHGVSPENALHVGDSAELDVAGANSARIAVVLVDPEPSTEQNPAFYGLNMKRRGKTLEEVSKLVNS